MVAVRGSGGGMEPEARRSAAPFGRSAVPVRRSPPALRRSGGSLVRSAAALGIFIAGIAIAFCCVLCGARLRGSGGTSLPCGLRGAHKTHFRGKTVRVGLGWHKVDTKEGLNVFWHNGGTAGYVSFVGFAPKQQICVVVLSNYGDAMANDWSSDKLALDVLAALNRIR